MCEILADDSTDPEELAHRDWLKRRMEGGSQENRLMPTKLDREDDDHGSTRERER